MRMYVGGGRFIPACCVSHTYMHKPNHAPPPRPTDFRNHNLGPGIKAEKSVGENQISSLDAVKKYSNS